MIECISVTVASTKRRNEIEPNFATRLRHISISLQTWMHEIARNNENAVTRLFMILMKSSELVGQVGTIM